MMDVYVIKPRMYEYYLQMVDGSLESLQKLVDGYIELCTPAELRAYGIELLANEEGLLKGLEPNQNLYPFFFVGTLVAVGVSGEEFVSLTPAQMHFLIDWLGKLERSSI